MRVAMRKDLKDDPDLCIPCRFPNTKKRSKLSAEEIEGAEFIKYFCGGVKIRLQDQRIVHVQSIDIDYID